MLARLLRLVLNLLLTAVLFVTLTPTHPMIPPPAEATPLLQAESFCGFGSGSRINDDAGTAYQSYVAAAADSLGNLYAAWTDGRDGGQAVYFARSTDGTASFGTNVKINASAGSIVDVAVTLDGSRIYVVWDEGGKVYVSYSTDGGASWSAKVQASGAGAVSPWKSTIALAPDGTVYVAWTDARGGGGSEDVYISGSTNGGASFSELSQVNSGVQAHGPDMVVDSQGRVHVVWQALVGVEVHVYHARSDNKGSTFSQRRVDDSGAAQSDPSIAVNGDGSRVFVVWPDARSGGDIYLDRSTDGGNTFGTDVRVTDSGTNGTPMEPHVASDPAGSLITVAWEDPRNGQSEIYFALSENGGGSFGLNGLVTGSRDQAQHPDLVASTLGRFYVVWDEVDGGDTDVYGAMSVPGTTPPTVNFTPLYPFTNSVDTQFMQGGTAHRYYYVRQSDGYPAAGMAVNLSTGKTFVTDRNGILDLQMTAYDLLGSNDAIGSTHTQYVNVTGAYVGVCASPINGVTPSWTTQIHPRESTHSWAAGFSTGVKAGATAYGKVTARNGVQVSADADSDIGLGRTVDVGAGVGIEVGPEAEIGPIGVEAKVEAEILFMIISGANFDVGPVLDESGATERRKAFAALLVAGMAQTGGASDAPMVSDIIDALDPGVDAFDPYYADDMLGLGLKASVGGHVGASWGFSGGDEKKKTEWDISGIGINLINAEAEMAFFLKLKQYYDGTGEVEQYGLAAEQDLSYDLQLLQLETPFWSGSVSEYFGLEGQEWVFEEELIFENGTDELQAFQFSIGDGEETVIYTVEGEDLVNALCSAETPTLCTLLNHDDSTYSGGLNLGPTAIAAELSALLTRLFTLPYNYERVTAEELSSFEFGLEFNFNIQIVTIGAEIGLEYEEAREYTSEVGWGKGDAQYVEAEYTYDDYVNGTRAGDTHTLSDVTDAALDGMWGLITDFFESIGRWVEEVVDDVVDWVIDTVTDLWPFSAEMGALDVSDYGSMRVEGDAGSFTGTITLTASSWMPISPTVPYENPIVEGLTVVGPYHAIMASSGITTFNKPVTFTLRYDESQVADQGLDESKLDAYLWGDGHWDKVAPIVAHDTANNTLVFAETRLGQYTLGLDVTPPAITPTQPISGGAVLPAGPLVAYVTDKLSGVDASSIQMSVDGGAVSPTYATATGRLVYTPTVALSAGGHTLWVQASDHDGNAADSTWSFDADDTPPTASISAPMGGSQSGTVTVMGTATDANFARAHVGVIPDGSASESWVTPMITTPVSGGTIGSFDSTALGNGDYTLQLTVLDTAGNVTTDTVSIALSNPDFSVGATPTEQVLERSGSITYTLVFTPEAGFNSEVSLTLAAASGSLPSGLSYDLPASVTPSGGPVEAALTLTDDGTTPKGHCELVVVAVGGGRQHVQPLTLDMFDPENARKIYLPLLMRGQ